MSDAVSARLVALSRGIDASNAHRDPEAVTWGRLAKIGEEFGEVVAAYIGATGQNPRKGTTHRTIDVVEELLDVAVTALAAAEHMLDHDGSAVNRLDAKIRQVSDRLDAGPRRRSVSPQPEPTRDSLLTVTSFTPGRCNYASPTPWGVAQCALPVHGPEVDHAYSPSEALEDLSPTEAGDPDE